MQRNENEGLQIQQIAQPMDQSQFYQHCHQQPQGYRGHFINPQHYPAPIQNPPPFPQAYANGGHQAQPQAQYPENQASPDTQSGTPSSTEPDDGEMASSITALVMKTLAPKKNQWNREKEALQKEIQARQQDSERLSRRIQELERERCEDRKRWDREYAKLQSNYNSLKQKTEDDSVSSMTQQMKNETLQKENAELQEILKEKSSQLKRQAAELEESTGRNTVLEANLHEKNELVENLEAEIHKMKDDQHLVSEQLAESRTELDDIRSQCDNIEKHNNTINEQSAAITILEAKSSDLENKLEEATNSLTKSRDEIKRLEEEHRSKLDFIVADMELKNIELNQASEDAGIHRERIKRLEKEKELIREAFEHLKDTYDKRREENDIAVVADHDPLGITCDTADETTAAPTISHLSPYTPAHFIPHDESHIGTIPLDLEESSPIHSSDALLLPMAPALTQNSPELGIKNSVEKDQQNTDVPEITTSCDSSEKSPPKDSECTAGSEGTDIFISTTTNEGDSQLNTVNRSGPFQNDDGPNHESDNESIEWLENRSGSNSDTRSSGIASHLPDSPNASCCSEPPSNTVKPLKRKRTQSLRSAESSDESPNNSPESPLPTPTKSRKTGKSRNPDKNIFDKILQGNILDL